jgi:hypothetical protein
LGKDATSKHRAKGFGDFLLGFVADLVALEHCRSPVLMS